MIDFSKKIPITKTIKQINPIEIYNTLDRKSDVGPLRPIQERILCRWFEGKRDDKDLIVKLHTGAGKTLIGLLMGMSYINSDEGPVIFACPNIYLMKQACQDANKFGIPFCIIDDSEMGLPNDFISGKKILITYVQKIFNGLSVFGIGTRSQSVGCIILDDSHACMDSIANSCTIKITQKDNYEIYNTIKNLFEDDLKNQGIGTYQDLNNGSVDSLMAIPYWNWFDKSEEVAQLLSKNSNEKCIKFAWPIIKDQINMCQAFISGTAIEISPLCTPIEAFGTFSKAKHRVLMSATTQEDTFFIRGLDMSIDSVKEPLVDIEYKWSGEKMILIPQLICQNTNIESVKDALLSAESKKFGKVVLTPSFSKAKEYEKYGAKIANSPGNNMFSIIQHHKANFSNSILVFANRYDGIDLPDDSCRILFIDSLPYYDSFSDRYEEQCKSSSDIVKIKTIQKIEQGLGRSVRGEKDYSAIIIFGADLIKYLKCTENTKFFSPQTRKQLEIGFAVTEMMKEEVKDDEVIALISTINQCLDRDEGWKAYYISSMDEIEEDNDNNILLYELLNKERAAYTSFKNGDIESACLNIQTIVNLCTNDEEQAWYSQLLARYTYPLSKSQANDIQISAFRKNNELLKPLNDIPYKKLIFPLDEKRAALILQKISQYNTFSDLSLEVEDVLSKLSFGTKANTFEKSFQELGEFLGFASQRPDKTIRKGPDNLWCDENNNYILIECKSEVSVDRDFIKKTEAGQMSQHCAWFEDEYNIFEYSSILVIPTNKLAYDAYFDHNTKIMTSTEIGKLKVQVHYFFNEFKKYDIKSISTDKIAEFMNIHKLSVKDILSNYTVDVEK